jgi:triosephosphate isomerase
MVKKIIVANWKMNHSFDEADQWLNHILSEVSNNKINLSDIEIVLCPAAIMIDYIDSELMDAGFKKIEILLRRQNKEIDQLSDEEITDLVVKERMISLGAQDCHHQQNGSFTGDISAEMLQKVGCKYVIIGHSERRKHHFESDQIIAKKFSAAIEKNIIPILCVGEEIEIRKSNQHLNFIASQLKNSIPDNFFVEKLVIAYEPIWSIGSGENASTQQISEVLNFIKHFISDNFANNFDQLILLYGGSVNSDNSGEITKINNCSGLLVGKASLDATEFIKICKNSL